MDHVKKNGGVGLPAPANPDRLIQDPVRCQQLRGVRASTGAGGVATLSTADVADDFNVKVLGYLRTAQAVIPHFAAHKWGRIINIGGLAARQVGIASGSIRNVGVAALTKTLADELGQHGVTCQRRPPWPDPDRQV